MCDQEMTEHDLKLSKRLALYARDKSQDKYERLIQRVLKAISVKEGEQDIGKPEGELITDELP